MPFKQMPPDLTDFNNWWNRIKAELPKHAKNQAIIAELDELARSMALMAWAECERLHTEYLSGELARIEAERQSE